MSTNAPILDVDLSTGADIHCPCGNDPSSDGFYAAILHDGVWREIEEFATVPRRTAAWDVWQQHYRCARCGQIHHDTGDYI